MKTSVSLFLLCAVNISQAHVDPRWEQISPEVREWFARQKQPDNRMVGCCGLADAYYADKFVMKGERYYAIITDERQDASLGRPHRPIGTEVEIPPHKFNDVSKLTGTNDPVPEEIPHGIVFINVDGNAICYFNPPNDG